MALFWYLQVAFFLFSHVFFRDSVFSYGCVPLSVLSLIFELSSLSELLSEDL